MIRCWSCDVIWCGHILFSRISQIYSNRTRYLIMTGFRISKELRSGWYHYCDVIMSTMASQNHQPRGCLHNRLLWDRSKKTSKFRVTGLCEENSPVHLMTSSCTLITPWWSDDMEMFSVLQAPCEGNPSVTGAFFSQQTSDADQWHLINFAGIQRRCPWFLQQSDILAHCKKIPK